ncbi:prefoldin subunit alpha [Candidatus Woesearchaeota archaeon]|nr:prefoldin subunit alpha [Candidatus Woesearchaeota archaeon]
MTIPKEKQEKAKEKYVELKLAEQKLAQIQQQIEQVSMQMMDVDETIQNIGLMKDVSPGTDIFVPVASGIFFPAKISSHDELLVNVGNNVVVAKSLEESTSLLSEQIGELVKLRDELNAQNEKMVKHAQQLQKELQGLLE